MKEQMPGQPELTSRVSRTYARVMAQDGGSAEMYKGPEGGRPLREHHPTPTTPIAEINPRPSERKRTGGAPGPGGPARANIKFDDLPAELQSIAEKINRQSDLSGLTVDYLDERAQEAIELATTDAGQREELIKRIQDAKRPVWDRNAEEFRRIFIAPIERALAGEGPMGSDPRDVFRRIQEREASGELSHEAAAPLIEQLGEFSKRMPGGRMEKGDDIVDELDALKKKDEAGYRRRLREEAKEFIVDEPIGDKLLSRIVEDDEASEIFFNQIIGAPLTAERSRWVEKISFYARINLEKFLNTVGKREDQHSRERHNLYEAQKDAIEIFHDMNRVLLTESGNPEEFERQARTVHPIHLQTAHDLVGVEQVRHLYEQALGRFYTSNDTIFGDNIETEINKWVEDEFRLAAEAEDSTVRSQYANSDGTGKRKLEEWEIRRAIAVGKNIHSSFYRTSEMVSWGKIPKNWEGWIKSMPAETVVRVLAGFKFLGLRFRMEDVRGGVEFTNRINHEIQHGYNELLQEGEEQKIGGKRKVKIHKIGLLDVVEDLIPVGMFKGAGFDKGWRTLQAYLNSDLMMIKIPDPSKFSDAKRPGEKSIRERVQELYDQHEDQGHMMRLGDFLFDTEYTAQILTSDRGENTKVAIAEEHRFFDSKEQQKRLNEVIKVLEAEMPGGQVNMNLGVMLSWGGCDNEIKEMFWKKTAGNLPLRIAYLLSEEGIRDLPGFEAVSGGKKALFNEVFERKLMKAQSMRLEAQKQNPNVAVALNQFISAENKFTPEEIAFVQKIQEHGEKYAWDLARVPFPHIPFLEDVPFGVVEKKSADPEKPAERIKGANFLKLGDEVFRRRMGGDFNAFYGAFSGYSTITGGLNLPLDKILEAGAQIVKSISTPENVKIGQDVFEPIFKAYLEMAEQWVWTRWPFIKSIRGIFQKPTSWLQHYYDLDAPSEDEAAAAITIKAAVGAGTLRRIRLPGEKESQARKLANEVGAAPKNVIWREFRNMAVVYALMLSWSAFKSMFEDKDKHS